jgi:hypothetical protein
MGANVRSAANRHLGTFSFPARPGRAAAARLADRVVLPMSPAALSCLRLGLPADYLYS